MTMGLNSLIRVITTMNPLTAGKTLSINTGTTRNLSSLHQENSVRVTTTFNRLQSDRHQGVNLILPRRKLGPMFPVSLSIAANA